MLGEKAAVQSGKTMVRALFSGAFRNKNLSKMPLADMEVEMKVRAAGDRRMLDTVRADSLKAIFATSVKDSHNLV